VSIVPCEVQKISDVRGGLNYARSSRESVEIE
jgi:hypothetical protein